MVEQSINLDYVFQALSDKTRRDIMRRVSKTSLSISDLAQSYRMSFAAIAKHIVKLERANLVTKNREGKQQIISAVPKTVEAASTHLELYEKLWNERFDALELVLKSK